MNNPDTVGQKGCQHGRDVQIVQQKAPIANQFLRQIIGFDNIPPNPKVDDVPFYHIQVAV